MVILGVGSPNRAAAECPTVNEQLLAYYTQHVTEIEAEIAQAKDSAPSARTLIEELVVVPYERLALDKYAQNHLQLNKIRDQD